MAIEYPDKRARYAGLSAADFTPGAPRSDNPTKHEGKVTKAARDGAPREKFRVATDPNNPANQPPVEVIEPPKPAFDAVPDPALTEL